jgi:C-terminal processing protease CtpA/Prc
MFVGTFDTDFDQFPLDVDAAIKQLQESEVTNLLIDVTNNPGACNALG